MTRNTFHTTRAITNAKVRRAVAGLALAALAAVTAAPLQAQTTGTIPVWVDPPTLTLGDSPLVQCGDGSSVCVGPGSGPAIGSSSTLLGFTGSTALNASAVYGEATASTGTTNGVVGVTQSGDDGTTGVFGWAASCARGVTTGVWGRSSSPVGRGVVAEGATGVYALTNNDGFAVFADAGVSGFGVYAQSREGWAGYFDGLLGFNRLGFGGTQPLCRNVSGGIADCSSSLRYKTDVHPFSGGLDIVKQLRPIAFTWKQGGAHDVGLAAEDVEQVEPLLTFRNDNDEIEGVKYNQLSAVFVNAFVEQQAQIQRQQKQIDALRALVCSSHPDADACR